MRSLPLLIILLCYLTPYAQEKDTTALRPLELDTLFAGTFQDVEVMDPEALMKIREYKRRLKRIYPMAMHASQLIDQYNDEIEDIEKQRKVRKYGRNAYKELKHEFKYTILQTYQGDGVLLMKLIQKETGYTVHEIIKRFRGGGQAMLFQVMAKMWDNDLKTDYNPESNKWDWAIDVAIQELDDSGELDKLKLDIITKEEHKELESKRKKRKKDRRKKQRQAKKKKKKEAGSE